ncbi:MAG: glycogen debranching protein GlgX [Acidimicrobiales bacterium]
MQTWPGTAFPLGATFDGNGTNVSLFSEVADLVELCLFLDDGEERIALTEVDGHCWHGYVPGIGPGTRYGFRVHGPWDPANGQWCNPAKLLLDPYAKAVEGQVRWDPACFAHRLDDPDRPNEDDSAPYVPKGVVHLPFFDWGNDRPPDTPLHHTVIYEAHVKGLTARHPAVPPEQRGTYAGVAHPAVVEHLVGLGVTAIELQPVHQFVHDAHLLDRGLRNYWGYSTIGYFAPHNEYAATGDHGEQVQELKAMVRDLHQAGIEVILDVVYNHTAEGNHQGPTLSFRGIDNAAYYRLADDRRHYMDYTGTGNTLNMRHPHVLQLVMDSLRYWVTEMHVDGFRFDLASTLARGLHEVDRLSAFFDLIQQDPVVSQVKLIAEPWDVGEGGYQVGNFPPHWSEWNGRYRDTVRDFWRGEPATMGEFASRLTGSSDLYEGDSRHPNASINFITAHDGFTLADLVAYDDKHNEANGEGNADGESHNRSWNGGVEGPTDDPEVNALRARQQRNLLATLLLSQGVPMLLMGDEMGRSQGGNNNAYCQDNEVSWVDWDDAAKHEDLLAFTTRLLRLRREHPVFRRRRWFGGRPIRGRGTREIAWLRPDGAEMTDDDWDTGFAKAVGLLLDGTAIPWPGPRGEPVVDDRFLVLFNAHHEPLPWTLPRHLDVDEGPPIDGEAAAGGPSDHGGRPAAGGCELPAAWLVVVDTARPELGEDDGHRIDAGSSIDLAGRAVVVLRGAEPPERSEPDGSEV